MTKIVFKMIAMILEGIVVLIFSFPASPASGDNLSDIVGRDDKISDKGRFVKDFTSLEDVKCSV